MIMDPIRYLESRLSSLSLDGFEIYRTEKREMTVEAKEGQVDSLDRAVERGIAVRLFREGLCGFSCSSDETTAFLDRMTDLAYNSLQIVEEGGRIRLPTGKANEGPKPGGLRTEVSGPAQIALDLERFAMAYDTRVLRVRDASYSEEESTITLRNSRGLDRTFTRARYSLSLMVMAEEKGRQEMAWDHDFSTDLSQLNPKDLAERAAEKAVSQLGGRPVPTQKAAALLDPSVAASFVGVLSPSFYADQIQKNRSALRGRKGEKFYAPAVAIVDDGTLEGGFESFPFDAEGVPSRRNALVSGGVVQGFLYDLSAAEKEEGSSTGNAVRPSFKEPPRVGATNFFISRGSGGTEDLLGAMGRGFWIRDVIGMHTVDPVTGDFSVGASGQWVEGGKPSHPVRGVTVSGNLHELLRRVERVGGEMKFYHSFGAPQLLIGELDIGGK